MCMTANWTARSAGQEHCSHAGQQHLYVHSSHTHTVVWGLVFIFPSFLMFSVSYWTDPMLITALLTVRSQQRRSTQWMPENEEAAGTDGLLLTQGLLFPEHSICFLCQTSFMAPSTRKECKAILLLLKHIQDPLNVRAGPALQASPKSFARV